LLRTGEAKRKFGYFHSEFMTTTLSPPSAEKLEKLIATLEPFIAKLQQDGYNIGIDSYCAVHNLLLALASQGTLSDDFSQLRTLIAPILCCSQQEQAAFNRYFDDWLQILQPPQEQAVPNIVEDVKKEAKKPKIAYFLLAFLVVVAFGIMPFRPYLGELISAYLFEKSHPYTPEDWVSVLNKKPDNSLLINDSKELSKIPKQFVFPRNPNNPDPINIAIPTTKCSPTDKVKFALWIALAILALILLGYCWRYLQLQRFLKRYRALQPPDMRQLFLNEQEKSIYPPTAFVRIAQQLHKHRDLDTHLLDVEATVKRTIQRYGFYTPVYKAIKALPEYLVLIDRSSFNDQLSHFVESLLKQLDDFGLFIERYYFDGDPRRCYSQRNPTTPCTLETLQSLYSHHRLIIFADSRHFLDPITGELYAWLTKFNEWQRPFLFTLESPEHWDYYKQKLHETGFVVLATGKEGLNTLVSYISADIARVQEPRGSEVDNYPSLLQQRPRRFLERHSPTPAVVAELLRQLHDYLDKEGVVWLSACSVYPELHWPLTLFWGKRDKQKQFDEALLLRLARLPWLRYGYMPDWLRESLSSELNHTEKRAIHKRLDDLFQTITTQGSMDDFSLSITEKSPLLNFMREVLLAWRRKSDSDSPLQDYVFQSFMAGQLAVKLPKAVNQLLVRFDLVAKMCLVVVLMGLFGVGLMFTPQQPIETINQVALWITSFEHLQNPDQEVKQIDESTNFTIKLLDKRYPPPKQILRSVHPKSHGCVKATFTINPDIASEFQVGLFAEPGKQFDAVIRFSNASALVEPDIDTSGRTANPPTPDKHGSRGMAIKVLNVSGEVLTEDNGARNQDFLMINQPVFAFANAKDYLRLDKVIDRDNDNPAAFFAPLQLQNPNITEEQKQNILAYIKAENIEQDDIERIVDTFKIIRNTQATPVTNPLGTRYFSAAPFLFGSDHVMKFSAKPLAVVAPTTISDPLSVNYLREVLTETMNRNKAIEFDFMLQVRSKADDLDIENASSLWDEAKYPFVSVAKITIPAPQPDINSEEHKAYCEKLAFTPWHSLPEFQPVGSINRLRKSVYQASAEHRLEQSSFFVRLMEKLCKFLFG
jgi:catalase